MQVYTVDQILGVRDRYKDAPYPGFSLDEVIRRKRQQGGHKLLTKGEKAWGSKMPASAEEGIARKVQGELNKLAPEKYSSVIQNLLDEQFFVSEKSVDVVIKVIFKKALEEPGYSELYARLCYDMARFEISDKREDSTSASPHSSLSQIVSGSAAAPKPQKKSYFRNSIISCVQSEFTTTNSAAAKLSTLEGEAFDIEEARLTRRKKANIKFVGQLYMQRVMFATTMLTIMHQLLKLDQPSFTPSGIDVEVLSELLETIGKTIDSGDNIVKLDTVFDRLKWLLTAKADDKFVYPPRMRFKIMDLLELRRNKWEVRVQRADSQTPTTLQEQAAKMEKAGSSGGTGKSLLNSAKAGTPSTGTPSSKKNGSQRFPSTPSQSETPSPVAPTWRNIMAPVRDGPGSLRNNEKPAARNAEAAEEKKGGKPFAVRVRELMTLWLNENRDEVIPEWQETLRSSEFSSQEERNQKIVSLVVHEACTVTTKGAQESAGFFLIRGLELEDDDLYLGLSEVLVNAISIGLMEDVPKFNERFVRVLTMMAGRSDDELYCHGAKILYNTLARLEPTDDEEDNIEPLLKIWNALRVPEPDATLTIYSLMSVVALREKNQEKFVARLVGTMVQKGVISFEVLQQWCDKPETVAQYALILDELTKLKVLEAKA